MSKIILNGIEYSNGIIYEELQPVIYSTEEREIGVYTDGKPLYQKTWDFGSAITVNSNTWTDTSISNSNIEAIVKVVGGNLFSGKISCFDGLSATADTGSVVKILQSINLAISVRYLTLQYTKTTDTAGSGTWTPSGANAVHYSTNEQVIGTFLGKPLYEKTFELDNVTIPTSGYTYSLSGLNLNIENVIKNPDCFIVYGGTNCLTLPYNVDTSYFIISEFIKENSDGVMFFRRGGGNLATDKIIFTLQYTKTTD